MLSKILSVVVLFMLIQTTAYTQIRLIKDLDARTSYLPIGSNPNTLKIVNNILYFLADDGVHGQELWRSNGTEQGTKLVKNTVFDRFAGIDTLVVLNDNLYFSCSAQAGIALWKSDGTNSGTFAVKQDFVAIGAMAAVGENLFFSAFVNGSGWTLWISDGTEAGTQLIKSFENPPMNDLANLTNVDGILFFEAEDIEHGKELWKSNGTEGGTVLVKDITPGATGSELSNLYGLNNLLYFISASDTEHGAELWVSDGTLTGTKLLKDINPGAASSNVSNLFGFKNQLFFSATDGVNSTKLWRTSGTSESTVTITSSHPTADYRFPKEMTVCRDTLFFTAWSYTPEDQIWKLNFGANSAKVVIDIQPGFNYPAVTHLFTFKDSLYYIESFSSIRKSDGISLNNGTQLIKEFEAPIENVDFISTDSRIFFVSVDQHIGKELWVSDGKPNGVTNLVKDINKGVYSSDPSNFVADGDKVYFIANADVPWPWVTDGTTEGTTLLQNATYNGGGSYPTSLFAFGNKVIFNAYLNSRNDAVWYSEGTSQTTAPIKNSGGSYGHALYHSHVFFFTKVYFPNSQDFEIQLWKTNGTVAGTVPVKTSLQPGLEIKVFGDYMYFNNGGKLWKSDGTESGTNLLYTPPSGVVATLFTTDNKLYFLVYHDQYFYQLGVSDGTSSGTIIIKDLGAISDFQDGNDICYFNVNYGFGPELWTSDGTESGTKKISPPSPVNTPIGNAASVNAILIFQGGDPEHGAELWKSDGTLAGTSMLKDIKLDYSAENTTADVNSFPLHFTKTENSVLFLADDGVNAFQVWETDGTMTGTKKLTNEANHIINNIFHHNQITYVVASHSDYGNELFAYDESLVVSTAQEQHSSFQVFPNPTNSFLYIQTDNESLDAPVSVFSTTGNIIEVRSHRNENQLMVDFSETPSGIYILKTFYDSKIRTYRIVVKH